MFTRNVRSLSSIAHADISKNCLCFPVDSAPKGTGWEYTNNKFDNALKKEGQQIVSTWDESLETGNAMIDDQHRQLINLLDELIDEALPDNNALRMVEKVMDFAIAHFLMEEELMTEANYPPDATQAMVYQHKDFKTDLRLRVLEFRQGETFDVISFRSFVATFLRAHEFGSDRQLADWIRKHGDTLRAA